MAALLSIFSILHGVALVDLLRELQSKRLRSRCKFGAIRSPWRAKRALGFARELVEAFERSASTKT